MKENKNFKINIYGLKLGSHEFSFDINKEFFETYENSVIDSGSGHCDIELVKKERLIEINFKITTSIQLICDRSLEAFDYTMSIKEQLIVKYGEEFDDSDDEIWTIPNSQQSLNVGKCIFDYMTLAVPMKKLHPKFEDEDGNELELVYSSDEEDQSADHEEIDPRWALLKKIKNKEN